MAEKDHIEIVSITFQGVPVESIFDLLALLRKPVKEEAYEGDQPRFFNDEQLKFLKDLSKGKEYAIDPSHEPAALASWGHLLQEVNVNHLRHTHQKVSPKFRHGKHKGQKVLDLAKKLRHSKVRLDDLPPLVCLKWQGVPWVICGNRRLVALKEVAKNQSGILWGGNSFPVRCIVHPDPKSAPPKLIAKFLLAWDTTCHGMKASIRGPPASEQRVSTDESIGIYNPKAEMLRQAKPAHPDMEDRPRFTSIPDENDDFYVRYYVGHKGKYGHEFLEFELRPDGRLRYANNSNYNNYVCIRKECHVTPAVVAVLCHMILESEIVKVDDNHWPAPDRIGRQELEIVVGNEHISFTTSKIGSLADVQASKDPAGLGTFYYLVKDLKAFVFSLIGLNFRVKPV